MDDRRPDRSYGSRRAFLGSIGAGTVLLAGCLGGGSVSAGSDDVPVRGDPDADLTLEVYEDFLCPACQHYYTEVFPSQVHERYLEPELIRYEHRDFPFLGPESWQAASATREVKHEYGLEEFWAYKAELMERGGRIENDAPDIFGTIAAELELDGDAIQTAASERAYDSEAEADRDRGEDLGVNATPSFVVDGELMDGFDAAIQEIDARVQ